MKRVMLIGETGSGKRELIRALSNGEYVPRRAMAAEYLGPFIHTPGEFLENRRFYRALITTSLECAALLFLHNASHHTSLFPPKFASIFNRRVIGIITGTDEPGADIALAERFLRNAGVCRIFPLRLADDADVDKLRVILF